MRLKLVFIVSIIAALIGSGASIGIVLGVFASLRPLNSPSLLVISTFVLPLAAIVWATIFVYRHTARRRRLQAVMTALLSLLLTLGAFTAAVVLTSRSTRIRQQTTPPPRNSG
jgi:purine-cytosine permease-like protein